MKKKSNVSKTEETNENELLTEFHNINIPINIASILFSKCQNIKKKQKIKFSGHNLY